MAKLIASPLLSIPHLAAFDDLAKQSLGGIDLTPALVYFIDTVDEQFLPILAMQFDVLGNKGWNLAANTDERRGLLKKAIELHRYKGTIYAIKEAVKSVGFLDVQVIEHVGFDLDGTWTLDGSNLLAGGFWADFRVKITVPDDKPLGGADVVKIVAMVNEYKNVRSRLVDTTFAINFSDVQAIGEAFDLITDPFTQPDSPTEGFFFNGSVSLNGGNQLAKFTNPLTLKVYVSGSLVSTETL